MPTATYCQPHRLGTSRRLDALRPRLPLHGTSAPQPAGAFLRRPPAAPHKRQRGSGNPRLARPASPPPSQYSPPCTARTPPRMPPTGTPRAGRSWPASGGALLRSEDSTRPSLPTSEPESPAHARRLGELGHDGGGSSSWWRCLPPAWASAASWSRPSPRSLPPGGCSPILQAVSRALQALPYPP